jgi:lipopolysaccharide/colanic/teichoic acid biosynthesis glycosyltransferase
MRDPLVSSRAARVPPKAEGIPRWADAALAATALLLLAPLLVLVAAGVRLTSRGPVLFRQDRVGRGGRPFTMLKFRSMRASAGGPQLTVRGDFRVTPFGRFLRWTKLDELPELWNVLLGDMSLVGPRPEVPTYVDLAHPAWREVLSARPGVTDPVTATLRNEEDLLAAVDGDRDEFYRSVLLPLKIEGYRAYLRRRTVASDLRALASTVLAVCVPGAGRAAETWRPLASTPTGGWGLAGRHRRALVVVVHLALAALSNYLAFLLRFDLELSASQVRLWAAALPLLLIVRGVVFAPFGLYRGLWRYASVWDARNIAAAVVSSSLVFTLLWRAVPGGASYPRSVYVLDALLLVLLLGGLQLGGG